jgi:hypothetical protein
VLEQDARVDARDELRVGLEHAVEAQDVGDEVVGEQRQGGEAAGGGDPGEGKVRGGDLRALEERHLLAVVGRDVAPAGPARQPRREPLRGAVPAAGEREERPVLLIADALAELAQVGGEQRHQLVLGVLSHHGGDVLGRRRGERGGGERPVRAQPGLDGAKAGHAGRLAQRREPARPEVDRVELEQEGGARLVAGALEVGRRGRLGGQRRGVGLDRVLDDPDRPRALRHPRAALPDRRGQAHRRGA